MRPKTFFPKTNYFVVVHSLHISCKNIEPKKPLRAFFVVITITSTT